MHVVAIYWDILVVIEGVVVSGLWYFPSRGVMLVQHILLVYVFILYLTLDGGPIRLFEHTLLFLFKRLLFCVTIYIHSDEE